ncbi:MAG: helix-turn-helix domain-containing protein [Bacteroidetes bacterium]|nr:helix-turn-helix domain-containing protein [Bacteroidota bacterium]
MGNENDYFSIWEASKFAKVAYETVARWIRSGRLVAEKQRIKGQKMEWRIKKTDLIRFLEG